jgi:hypothetical protein
MDDPSSPEKPDTPWYRTIDAILSAVVLGIVLVVLLAAGRQLPPREPPQEGISDGWEDIDRMNKLVPLAAVLDGVLALGVGILVIRNLRRLWRHFGADASFVALRVVVVIAGLVAVACIFVFFSCGVAVQ